MVVRGCRVVRQTAQRTTRRLVRQLVSRVFQICFAKGDYPTTTCLYKNYTGVKELDMVWTPAASKKWKYYLKQSGDGEEASWRR